MALDVLADRPQGADSNEIIKLIRDKFGIDVPRTSMSPQLSRLKADGRVMMEDKIWRLPQSGESKNEAPTGGNPGGASEGGEGETSPIESRDDPSGIFG